MANPIPWSPTLQATRARNHSPSSGAPTLFTPITPAPEIYTDAGRANQYGAGRRNGRTVRVIIVHETEGGGLDDDRRDFVASMQYSAYRAEDVSATAYVGRSGDIGYDVPEKDRPFTTGRWNDESLSVEIDGRAAWTRAQWLAAPAQIEAVIELLVDWCQRFDIPPDFLSAGEVAYGASRQSSTPVQGLNRGITDHRTANAAAIALGGSPATYSHTCPGDAFHALLIDEIVPEVARRLDGTPDPTPVVNPRPIPLLLRPKDFAMPDTAAYIWIPAGYANAFLFRSSGAVEHLTPSTIALFTGVPRTSDNSPQKLTECLAKTGLDASALVPA